MDNYTYGHCKNYGQNNNLNVVYINSSWWSTASDMSREQLMFHELGHCVLDRRHDDTVIVINDWQTPKSIMYSDPFGDYHMYKENLNYYYNELCGGQI